MAHQREILRMLFEGHRRFPDQQRTRITGDPAGRPPGCLIPL
jgi:hypothetical protein